MQQSNPASSSKKILVAVLNWGLGHAARSTPLIQGLLAAGHEVVLASDGRAGLLLRKEFPSLPYEELPAYNIWYGSRNMVLNLAWQWPKIIMAARQEHNKLKSITDKHKLDLVISDSRFGCFHPNIRSIFITHQLWIKTPIPTLSFMINTINHRSIAQFEECWIPDWPNTASLAGELSRPIPSPICRYIGLLSRMRYRESPIRYPLIALLSGPEPQRTRFEKMILDQAKPLQLPMVVIQGKTEGESIVRKEGPITIIPHLSGHQLNETLLSGALILCRAGYSSIMDLIALQKPAILVPTPGQTEQEYLANSLTKKGWFYSQEQRSFDLVTALEAAKNYRHPTQKENGESGKLFEAAIASL